MTHAESENIAAVRSYLAALESGATGADLGRFFTHDAVQIELPNRLNPNGGQSDLSTMLKRAEQGQKLLRQQKYELRSEIVRGPLVAVEAIWSAVLAMPMGSLPAGSAMKAHFAMFFVMRDTLIAEQRNYDCFDPW